MHLVRQIYNNAPPLGSAAGAAAGAEAEAEAGAEARAEAGAVVEARTATGGSISQRPNALETTAAEWQRPTAAIGLGLWWWRSTALSPPEPVG